MDTTEIAARVRASLFIDDEDEALDAMRDESPEIRNRIRPGARRLSRRP